VQIYLQYFRNLLKVAVSELTSPRLDRLRLNWGGAPKLDCYPTWFVAKLSSNRAISPMTCTAVQGAECRRQNMCHIFTWSHYVNEQRRIGAVHREIERC